MNAVLPENQNGCFSETFLQNQCAAAAFDAKRGLLKPDNVYVAVGDTLAQVQQAAQQKCVQAGDDILLMPADLSAAVKGIEDAVSDGTLTEARIDESVLRILELKEKRGML